MHVKEKMIAIRRKKRNQKLRLIIKLIRYIILMPKESLQKTLRHLMI